VRHGEPGEVLDGGIGAEAVRLLRSRSVCVVESGLTAEEIVHVEQLFGLEFADDHLAFLSAGLPAVELVGELRRLDRRIAAVTQHLSDAVDASGTTLTTVFGVGAVVAAKLLARTGPVGRFRSADAFASYAGVAPIEGFLRRRRPPSPVAGRRSELNYSLHVIAITQIRRNTAGKTYYQAKRTAGKGHKEALRCLKRRLGDVV
jgi:transposase